MTFLVRESFLIAFPTNSVWLEKWMCSDFKYVTVNYYSPCLVLWAMKKKVQEMLNFSVAEMSQD